MIRKFALMALLSLGMPAAALAQEAGVTAESKQPSTLQERLMPESTVRLMAPAMAEVTADAESSQPAVTMPRGSGTGLMIAGGALFVAGLLVSGDVGTLLAVTGAAVGAYGLYLYFG